MRRPPVRVRASHGRWGQQAGVCCCVLCGEPWCSLNKAVHGFTQYKENQQHNLRTVTRSGSCTAPQVLHATSHPGLLMPPVPPTCWYTGSRAFSLALILASGDVPAAPLGLVAPGPAAVPPGARAVVPLPPSAAWAISALAARMTGSILHVEKTTKADAGQTQRRM
jgi:hypothetical protein